MTKGKKKPSGVLNTEKLWERIKVWNLTPMETSIGLGTFAKEYVDNTDRQIVDYLPFKTSKSCLKLEIK